jgi:hypothetical protein
MFRIIFLGLLCLWFWGVGLVTWTIAFHYKHPGVKPDFTRDYHSYSAWLTSMLPDMSSLSSLAPQVNMPAINPNLLYWLPVIGLPALVAWFISEIVVLSASYKAVGLQLEALLSLRASTAFLDRRKRAHEDYRLFAEGISTAHGVKALFVKEASPVAVAKLAGIGERLNERFISAEDNKKDKASAVRAYAHLWSLLLDGHLRTAREFYEGNQKKIVEGSLKKLMQRYHYGVFFWAINKLVRRYGGHPLYPEIIVEYEDDTTRACRGMEAIFHVLAPARNIVKSKATPYFEADE